MKKITLLLEISQPQEVSAGTFKTVLTHPKLEGELSFIHSETVGRDEILKALDQNIVGHLTDAIDVIGGLINGTKQTVTTSSPGPTREISY